MRINITTFLDMLVSSIIYQVSRKGVLHYVQYYGPEHNPYA